MALTAHQSEQLEKGLEIIAPEGKFVKGARLLIRGSAGVGKTFLAETLIKHLLDKTYGLIYCSAPTNKAVGVLQSKVKLGNKRVIFNTIHQGLKIKMRIDNKTRTKVFEPEINEKYPPLKGVAVWVIDEASMISLKMQTWIEEHATRQGVTVIYLGDDKQINPVGEEDSPVFFGKPHWFGTPEEAVAFDTGQNVSATYKFEEKYVAHTPYPDIELTEIVRQGAGNPIIPLSRNIPAIWDYKTRMNPETGHGFVYTYDRDKIIDELALVNGTDDLKYLAYTNNEVDGINLKVREKIYGTPAKIELGETMVFDEPYGTYYISQEIKVETLDIEELKLFVTVQNPDLCGTHEVLEETLKVYVINGHAVDEWGDGDVVWQGVFVIHEESEERYKSIVTQLKASVKHNLIRYSESVAFENRFAKLKYNHALTVHKSQGSTFRRTILNVKNIQINQSEKEKTRLMYTGITRASELLILYNV